MEAAAAFLAVRPRSISETGRRLRHLSYPPPLVERVVERLIEMGYLDDEAFARAWVASRDRARPRGETVLRRELRLKGIERDVVVAVLGERAAAAETAEDATGAGPPADAVGADRAAAERLLARRRSALMREPDLRKRRQRAYALLARNGFDPDVCRDAIATLDPAAVSLDLLDARGEDEAVD